LCLLNTTSDHNDSDALVLVRWINNPGSVYYYTVWLTVERWHSTFALIINDDQMQNVFSGWSSIFRRRIRYKQTKVVVVWIIINVVHKIFAYSRRSCALLVYFKVVIESVSNNVRSYAIFIPLGGHRECEKKGFFGFNKWLLF